MISFTAYKENQNFVDFKFDSILLKKKKIHSSRVLLQTRLQD